MADIKELLSHGYGPGAADSNAFAFENPDQYNKRISELPANWNQLTAAQHQAYWDTYFDPNGAQGSKANTRADAGFSQGQDVRGDQAAFIKSLQEQAAGRGPSLAQGQLQQATDTGIKNAMAMGTAQQAQGLGGQAMMRGVADNTAAMQQQAAGQSALTRSMEQLQADQQLGQMLGGVRGQDMQLGASQGQMGLSYAQMMQQKAESDRAFAASLGTGAMAGAGQALSKVATAGAFAGGLVPGDSPANDTVPAMLSPGEVVIPRSVVQSENAPEKAAAFIDAIRKQARGKR